MLYGFAGSLRLADIAEAVTGAGRAPPSSAGTACCCSAWRCSRSACCSRSARCRSTCGPPTSTRAPRPRSPASWPPAPRSRRSAPCSGSLYVGAGRCRAGTGRPALWGVAILTMVVGSVVAMVQTDVKRMLAYSSIAHAGFLLTGVAGDGRRGRVGVLFYLFAYGFTTIGAFAVVTLVRDVTRTAASAARPPTCPSGPAWASAIRGRGRVHVLPAGLRRDPADQRLHRQVRGVLGRGQRTAPGCWH